MVFTPYRPVDADKRLSSDESETISEFITYCENNVKSINSGDPVFAKAVRDKFKLEVFPIVIPGFVLKDLSEITEEFKLRNHILAPMSFYDFYKPDTAVVQPKFVEKKITSWHTSKALDHVIWDYAKWDEIVWSIIEPYCIGRRLAFHDLHVYTVDGSVPENLIDAVTGGTKMFDAMIYFSSAEKDKIEVKATCADSFMADKPKEDRWPAASRMLAQFCVFCLFRGSYPTDTKGERSVNIPQFIWDHLEMRCAPAVLASNLASFSLGLLDASRFLPGLPCHKMGPDLQNRIRKSVAGYRPLNALTVLPVKAIKLSLPGVADKVNFFAGLLSQPQSWDLVACCRPKAWQELYGSINDHAMDLLLDLYDENELKRLVKAKALFEIPERKKKSQLKWNDYKDNVPELKYPIFAGDKRAAGIISGESAPIEFRGSFVEIDDDPISLGGM
jgi:hypothetical protein